MRTMLLSFKPEWYNRIKEGSKIFEYRRTFPDEEILAYMYVSSPMKMIVGKIHLGRKIDINTWKEEYKEDAQVCERVDDFLTRHSIRRQRQMCIRDSTRKTHRCVKG